MMIPDPRWIVRKRRLKAWALAHGVPIPKGYRVAVPVCGEACRALIRAVEAKAFGPLQVSGRWTVRLGVLVRPMLTIGEKAVRHAAPEVGVKETPPGSNAGPRVHEYQSATGAYDDAWCASFVTWCFLQAGKRLGGFNTAYCPSWVDAARSQRNSLSVVSRTEARAGDCALFDWGRDGVSDHIGLLTSSVNANGEFSTIEGNTSSDIAGDQSNGGEVCRKSRNTGQVLVFVRVSA